MAKKESKRERRAMDTKARNYKESGEQWIQRQGREKRGISSELYEENRREKIGKEGVVSKYGKGLASFNLVILLLVNTHRQEEFGLNVGRHVDELKTYLDGTKNGARCMYLNLNST
ncbi:hypothetical protein C8F04DRAFT_1192904 [Mycena alexandri]|uniref:Uncharacterized protein n=1 Tax=Mycena alexandri TaxID=1745969 RepID=A0AAD6SD07_9AGAR|nr:hypothetical protein C8F04DRAFT_1192904 [Mycena alexandri]